MNFKFTLLEDKENPVGGGDSDNMDVEIQYTEDEQGNVDFRFWNGRDYVNVDKGSPQYQRLLDELDEQNRINKIKEENPDFDVDAWREQNQERIDSINNKSMSDQILKDKRSERQQAADSMAVDSTKIIPRIIKNPPLTELSDILSSDFQNVVLTPLIQEADEKYVEFENDAESSLDDDIYDEITYNKSKYIEEYIQQNVPVVYLFIDRSGSWGKYEDKRDENGKRKISKKFILSQTIVSTFNWFMNNGMAYVKTFYFGSCCASEEDICNYMKKSPEELNELEGEDMKFGSWYPDDYIGGGTKINPVVDKLRPLSDKQLNVVILTDQDTENNKVEKPVHVNGAVWYIFAESWSTALQTQIDGDFQRRIYYTTKDAIQ